jgi:exopolyphosphatase/guanosine-5'-triphosphate,3'-diphosphate pyrophosphatase
VREAKNSGDIVRRARDEAGLLLEVVSGKEEARLICLGVLHGKPPSARSLVVDIGGGSTEIASAIGEQPTNLWSIAIGAVRLTEVFGAAGKISKKQLELMRAFASEAISERLPGKGALQLKTALGSSGTINAVVQFAAAEGTAHVTASQLSEAVDELVEMGPEARRQRFDSRRADIIVAGAVILEAIAHHLGLKAITAVDRGLRDGLLVDLMRRRAAEYDHSVAEAAAHLGARFYYDEKHARQVTRLALALFDDLAALHRLPAAARPLLEVAALLHDIGNAVNYQRHHKHTYYLIQNADLAGLADRERELVALIARFHRRSAPDTSHFLLDGLTRPEQQLVRKCATILRIADSLDRSHHQPVRTLRASAAGRGVVVRLGSRSPLDLELWDLQHEERLFRTVFGKPLELHVEGR